MKPEPIYYREGGAPHCNEDCRLYDGKRCEILGRRPGQLCEPAVKEMAEKLHKRATLADAGSLTLVAKDIHNLLDQLSDKVEEFVTLGGQFNLRVYHNGGCESIDLHQLNGEFEGNYLWTRELET